MTAFGATADAVVKYLTKGRKVLVEGRLRFNSWESEGGQRRNKVDVIAERVNFLPSAARNGNGGENGANELDGTLPEDGEIPF